MENYIKKYVYLFLENKKNFNSYIDELEAKRKAELEAKRKAELEAKRKAELETSRENKKERQQDILKDPNDWVFWSNLNN